jgi:hypothetical protein
VEALTDLIEQSKKGKFHWKAVDLSKPVKPPEWMVEGLIAKGDICVMVGEPGVGKSWLSMGLSVGLWMSSVSFIRALPFHRPLDVSFMWTARTLGCDTHENEVLGLDSEGQDNIRLSTTSQ